ncbi:DUF899 domain-containing protein [Phyllobacterium sp. 22229]|uniref:DUF899 domain-containing protein n=1 Tax=Phyllobacterium sp. 22229 TaxID=3453895 RepID=UPI003F8647D8
MNTHAHPDDRKVVSRAEWDKARKAFLLKEKAFTRQRDALNRERRALPMVQIEKDYVFEGPKGKLGLYDLFEGRRQLIVYHFMLGPGEGEGCPGCSFLADSIGNLAHLHARDTTLVVVSRAPLAEIEAYRKRMGWTFPWVSSHGSDFNYDFHVTLDEAVMPPVYNYTTAEEYERKGMPWFMRGEQPGTSVFLRDGDTVYHTYSSYGRGGDLQLGTYNYLDLTPLGRQEGWDGTPDLDGLGKNWVKRHDEYAGTAKSADDACCH